MSWHRVAPWTLLLALAAFGVALAALLSDGGSSQGSGPAGVSGQSTQAVAGSDGSAPQSAASALNATASDALIAALRALRVEAHVTALGATAAELCLTLDCAVHGLEPPLDEAVIARVKQLRLRLQILVQGGPAPVGLPSAQDFDRQVASVLALIQEGVDRAGRLIDGDPQADLTPLLEATGHLPRLRLAVDELIAAAVE